MVFRRFRRRFEHVSDEGKVTYPANWAGEVSNEVAKAADAAKATLVEKPSAKAKTETKADK